MMRIATKYPRVAERHFERTGRQVEVIEVKGSVELAPLIGLADGIVDLVATGRTLERTTSRFARRSSSAPPVSSPTESPTSCGPRRSTR